jgi:hypothetical protein
MTSLMNKIWAVLGCRVPQPRERRVIGLAARPRLPASRG